MGLPPRSLSIWHAAALLFSLRTGRTATSWHSLRICYALFYDPGWELPQYLAMGYVGDQLFARFDASTRAVLPQAPWAREVEKDDPHFWEWSSRRVSNTERRLKGDLAMVQEYHNLSRGFYTWQRMIGCELSRDGHKRGHYQYAYNGQDFISLDQETLTWTAADARAQVTKRSWEAEPLIAQSRNHFLEEECVELLQKFAEYGKPSLLRREPPVVKVSRKEDYDGLETLVCRAYGFYPKEINATWRRDREVWQQDQLHGSITPNADGTYHTWLSIRIDPKDRGRYQCRVAHAGLPEPLNLAWEEPGSSLGLMVGALLAVVVSATVLLAAGAIVYKKKHRREAHRAATRIHEVVDSLGSGVWDGAGGRGNEGSQPGVLWPAPWETCPALALGSWSTAGYHEM
ncbi:major histocompatibility complex class I-related gene protein-like isoform X2 [Varanus komodoensis]|uniref:major histocompatibility complex class I-related gene protein-like isoform X2 n=1 Tax=Varanus komodoensis TaxID=61221 RepID=UPI001CF7E019|nr:major histocompatibility complex class I-related gene protein-like isoform X2 [Varanus komodoensis]